MQSSNSNQIASFPQDNKSWKVDWLSNVIINPPEKSEPLISVFLSEIKDTQAFTVDSFGTNNFKNNYVEIKIGVGHLSLVFIGSVWKNGIQHEDCNRNSLFSLEVDTSAAMPIIFWQSTKTDNSRLITDSEYPTGWKAFSKIKESPLIAIPINGDPYGLLIPAIEIIRFYYLISSPMAIAVFYGSFESLTKSTPHIDHIKKSVSLTLNVGVDEKDAWVIARYWSSQLVKERIQDVHLWVQKNSINNVEKISQSTFFPFDGKSKLKFQGKQIIGADGVKRYLCTRLIHCTGPFLFNDVIIIKNARSKSLIKLTENPVRKPTHWPIYKQESVNIIASNEEPSKKYITKIIVDSESRFEGILNKALNIQTIDRDSERFPKILFNTEDNDKKISTANGTYGDSNTRPAKVSIDLNLDEVNSIVPERLTAFIQMLNYLRSEKGMIVETLSLELPLQFLNRSDYRPVEMFECAGEKVIGCYKATAETNAWVEVKVGNVRKPRGLIIVEVIHNSMISYLMELEQHEERSKDCYSILVLRKIDNSRISNDEFYEFVRRTCKKKGWASITKEDAALLKTTTLRHQKNLGSKIASKLSELIY